MGESVYRANCILLKKMWKLFDFVGGGEAGEGNPKQILMF